MTDDQYPASQPSRPRDWSVLITAAGWLLQLGALIYGAHTLITSIISGAAVVHEAISTTASASLFEQITLLAAIVNANFTALLLWLLSLATRLLLAWVAWRSGKALKHA